MKFYDNLILIHKNKLHKFKNNIGFLNPNNQTLAIIF